MIGPCVEDLETENFGYKVDRTERKQPLRARSSTKFTQKLPLEPHLKSLKSQQIRSSFKEMQIDSKTPNAGPSSILKKSRQQRMSPAFDQKPVLQKVQISEEPPREDLPTPDFKSSSPVYKAQGPPKPFSTEPVKTNQLKKAKEQYLN